MVSESDRLRIVHVITKGDVGGAQTHVVELATAQATRVDVTIVAGIDGPALERARDGGVASALVPEVGAAWSGGSLLAAYRAVRDRLVELAPDVVHGHSSHAGLLARAAARRLRIPSVYTAHGWPFQAGAPLRQRVSSYAGETVGAWLGDAVICLTEAEAANARFVVPRRRLWVVPNGIADVPVAQRRRQSGVAGPVGLVMVARFAPPKQQPALIDAMRALADLDWTLIFVGDGPDRPVCEASAAAAFPDGRVRFLGHRDDVPGLLAANDIAVLWSRYEGMPIALMEAMRAGLCCVANDLPGVHALFGGQRDGDSTGPAGVVAAGADELTSELRRLIEHPDEIDRLGNLARRRYLDAFTADAMATGTRTVYDAVMSRRRGRGGGTSGR